MRTTQWTNASNLSRASWSGISTSACILEDPMTDLSECDHFQDHRWAICRGERADLLLDGPNSINAYRVHWGLAPLSARPKGNCNGLEQVAEATVNYRPRPSLLQQVTTFAVALADHVRDGLAKCHTEQIDHRLAICRDCPEFTGVHCGKCGCACSGRSTFFNKLAWQSEKCPLGHW
jgi:hypothetical protein